MPLSKITTASLSTAAATSNVSVDNGTLFVDVTNNRVGLNGNQSPLAQLDINGDTGTFAGMGKIFLTDNAADSGSRNWAIGNGGTTYGNFSIYVSNAKGGNPINDSGSAGNAVFYIDSTGRATKPYHPYAAVARTSGSVTGPNVMAYNSVAQNIGNVYNSTNGRFTAPIAGRYFISFQTLSVGSSEFWAKVRLNGSSYFFTSYSAGITKSYANECGSGILQLAASDYVDIYIDRGVGYGNDASQSNAYFYFLG